MLRRLFSPRTHRRTTPPAIPAPSCVPAACSDMTPLPQLFSPLIAEMMAAYCHKIGRAHV